MKSSRFFLSLAGLLASAATGTVLAGGAWQQGSDPGAAAPQSKEPAQQESAGLIRVRTVEQDPSRLRPQNTEGFAPEEWIARLADPDLAAREKSFEALIELARQDNDIRAFVRQLRDEGPDPELAWTARLLLRDLRRKRTFHLQAHPFRSLPDLDLGFGLSSPDLQNLFGRELDLDRLFGNAPPGMNAKNVQIQRNEAGWTIVVTESVDGESKKRQYSGESLEAILEANPDLGAEIGMDAHGGFESFHFRLGERGLPPQLWSPDQEDRSLRGYLYRPDTQDLRTDKLGVIAGPISSERAEALGLEASTGLRVESVYPGTLAQVLGLRAGDVLVELNGKVLEHADDISKVLQARGADDPVQLSWIDVGGRKRTKSWSPQ